MLPDRLCRRTAAAQAPGAPATLAVYAGLCLFIAGGVLPLVYQAGVLPAVLLIASGVEIFFQKFLTGVVAAYLLGRSADDKTAVKKGDKKTANH